jgi:uncharacterized membrane protein YdjX (TVP38/TMEM64 family)
MLPVAPFSILNAVAGASHIRARDFFLGTVVGELPGLLGLALFLDQVAETVRHPGVGSVLLLVMIAVGIVWTAWALGRWLSNRPQENSSRESTT